uniref:Uncharacterized protein n=1 Tax=Candidatus Kentrum sp. MB TaxID=2138164 RepID=A0A450WYU9_9GAMM|nr:MAG: hypothetical protein BECKMB1821G_GA0114241_100191 [Candidatus Kentron sp. MB]VFK32599.1 MAG: hypothetical protein BECKMB1821I_GA0114274_103511 [Candidatus Kentron sp. MB]VFK75992.1 MAG: hypothetical protein BECKMB1821H_GA0114242_103810 [Candidatus Kentron sp. MB]
MATPVFIYGEGCLTSVDIRGGLLLLDGFAYFLLCFTTESCVKNLRKSLASSSRGIFGSNGNDNLFHKK